MNRMKSIISIGLFLMAIVASGQEWTIPAAQAAETNPFEYNLENIKRGKELYLMHCKSCHGDPGKNNPLTLVPAPVDIASERMQANSEGSLFHKITSGRGVMPPFGGTINEGDRWMLVHFIMNYNPGREQLLVDAPPVPAKLLASVSADKGAVEVMAEYEKEDGSFAMLDGAEVRISSKKAFGNMLIGKVTTEDNGRAEFAIPEDVIGDEEGYVSIVVSLGEGFVAEEVVLEEAIVGKPKEVPQLIRDEVLWSTNDNVSTWLLLSYLLAAGGAWTGIIYVIVQIVKIKRFGKSSQEA